MTWNMEELTLLYFLRLCISFLYSLLRFYHMHVGNADGSSLAKRAFFAYNEVELKGYSVSSPRLLRLRFSVRPMRDFELGSGHSVR